MKRDVVQPPLMKDEIFVARRKPKLGKTTGPDQQNYLAHLVIIECISSQHYLTKIEDTSQIPPNISKSKLIALPKQPRAREFELCRIRIISFMSHITKILLRILTMRFIHKIRLEHRYTVAYMEGNGAKFLLKLYLIEPRKH